MYVCNHQYKNNICSQSNMYMYMYMYMQDDSLYFIKAICTSFLGPQKTTSKEKKFPGGQGQCTSQTITMVLLMTPPQKNSVISCSSYNREFDCIFQVYQVHVHVYMYVCISSHVWVAHKKAPHTTGVIYINISKHSYGIVMMIVSSIQGINTFKIHSG